MENATKALLLAASVLIVIVLIAIGIKILGSAQGVTNSVEGVSQTMEISIFNSQFTKYEGRQNYAGIKQLINNIIVNNNREDGYTIALCGEDYDENGRSLGGGDVRGNERDFLNNSSVYSYFDVELDFDTNRSSKLCYNP